MRGRGMGDAGDSFAGNLARTSVLVVEDDDTIRDLVTQVLTEEGYEVLGAPDGCTALDLATRTCSGVGTVLLDLSLPDMDGRDFVARYTQLPGPPAPLVVFTAAHPTDAATAADQIGAAGFVTKPFDLDTLLEVVSRCHSISVAPLPHGTANGTLASRRADRTLTGSPHAGTAAQAPLRSRLPRRTGARHTSGPLAGADGSIRGHAVVGPVLGSHPGAAAH
ncbi:MAG: response regulator [Chloroflexota bacterium]|nr:response regulator [Chloroflexota bacterium]